MSNILTSECALPLAPSNKTELVDIYLPLTPPQYLNEPLAPKFLNVAIGALTGDTHILSQPLLAGKAKVVVPGVTQKHSISEL